MIRILKLVTPHQVNRAKRNNQLFLCEAPKCPIPFLGYNTDYFTIQIIQYNTDYNTIEILIIQWSANVCNPVFHALMGLQKVILSLWFLFSVHMNKRRTRRTQMVMEKLAQGRKTQVREKERISKPGLQYHRGATPPTPSTHTNTHPIATAASQQSMDKTR